MRQNKPNTRKGKDIHHDKSQGDGETALKGGIRADF